MPDWMWKEADAEDKENLRRMMLREDPRNRAKATKEQLARHDELIQRALDGDVVDSRGQPCGEGVIDGDVSYQGEAEDDAIDATMKTDHWQETEDHFIWWRMIPKPGFKNPFRGRQKHGPSRTDVDIMRSTHATF